jgi:hypothetical protein
MLRIARSIGTGVLTPPGASVGAGVWVGELAVGVAGAGAGAGAGRQLDSSTAASSTPAEHTRTRTSIRIAPRYQPVADDDAACDK